MTEARKRYAELQDVIVDPDFPDLDLALRRGRHVDREDFAWYTLLGDAQDHLETFYRRYGCELIHKADGYYYLLPSGEKLSRRQLGAGDMLVGQTLALLYLDPSTIERGGRVTHEDVVAQLVVVLGSDALVRAFNPKQKRRIDERVAQKNVRARIGEAIRHLAALGFVDLVDDGALRLRPALLRFAEPVRGLSAPAEALAKLVAEGEVALVTDAEHEASLDDAALDDAALEHAALEDAALEDAPASEAARADEPDAHEPAADELARDVPPPPDATALEREDAPIGERERDDDEDEDEDDDPPYVFADDDDPDEPDEPDEPRDP